ncbi:MAG: SusD/RagB family nutrient-binding outer membrane lipoprotein, partial [Gemmatimonadota bacterium]
MNKRIFARGVLAVGLIAALTACDQGLTDVNVDPNAPTDVGPAYLFPDAIESAVAQTYGSWVLLSHVSIWPQQIVEIQYPDEERGQVRPANMQGFWNTYYAGPLTDIETVISKGADSGDGHIQGAGLVWKTWVFHQVTDMWGDVPYSEATKASEGITTPVYDTQQEIYNGMFQDLTDAAGMLASGTGDFGGGDILYDNDFGKWRKFANALRMRLAMRLSEVDPATARAQFAAAYNDGAFTSNDDNAMFRWPGAPYRNPLYDNWTGRDDHGISATMVDTLKSFNDPRLELYAEPSAQDGEYRGLGNGIAKPPLSIVWYSRIGNFWRANGATTPSAIMTYAEVLFLEAEAAARGWISGDPAALYEAGIRASMNQYDEWAPANAPTDAEIDAYMAQPRLQYDAATGLDQIHLQQWIALYLN